MMILALLTLLLITNGSAEEEMVEETNVLGYIGHSVLLPCGCSDVQLLVWQRGERVVSFYQEGNSSPIDQDYMNRTENFLRTEKTNCSLKIFNISSADAGVYTCHALSSVTKNLWSGKKLNVSLTVSEKSHTIEDKPVTAVSVSVSIMAALLLAVVVILTLLIKRRHRKNTVPDLPAQQPMIRIV